MPNIGGDSGNGRYGSWKTLAPGGSIACTCWPNVESAAYAADSTFGQQVQAMLPPGASVFQLPYLPFPESPPMFGMSDYEPLRGYLNTAGFRWSYGATKGRPDAAWQQA